MDKAALSVHKTSSWIHPHPHCKDHRFPIFFAIWVRFLAVCIRLSYFFLHIPYYIILNKYSIIKLKNLRRSGTKDLLRGTTLVVVLMHYLLGLLYRADPLPLLYFRALHVYLVPGEFNSNLVLWGYSWWIFQPLIPPL